MSAAAGDRPSKAWSVRTAAIAVSAALAAIVLLANAHLVHVALSTQPECVNPASAGQAAPYRAAKPGC